MTSSVETHKLDTLHGSYRKLDIHILKKKFWGDTL